MSSRTSSGSSSKKAVRAVHRGRRVTGGRGQALVIGPASRPVSRQRSRAFRTKADADRYRSALLVAVQSGEPFDEHTGEPVSWEPTPDEVGAHDWARRWLAEQWPEWAPRTRASAVEALARLVPLLVLPTAPPPPANLRQHLTASLRPEGPPVDDGCERWLDKWCLRLGQLSRPVLASADQQLATGDDGQPLGPTTARRYRDVSKACVRRTVELCILDGAALGAER